MKRKMSSVSVALLAIVVSGNAISSEVFALKEEYGSGVEIYLSTDDRGKLVGNIRTASPKCQGSLSYLTKSESPPAYSFSVMGSDGRCLVDCAMSIPSALTGYSLTCPGGVSKDRPQVNWIRGALLPQIGSVDFVERVVHQAMGTVVTTQNNSACESHQKITIDGVLKFVSKTGVQWDVCPPGQFLDGGLCKGSAYPSIKWADAVRNIKGRARDGVRVPDEAEVREYLEHLSKCPINSMIWSSWDSAVQSIWTSTAFSSTSNVAISKEIMPEYGPGAARLFPVRGGSKSQIDASNEAVEQASANSLSTWQDPENGLTWARCPLGMSWNENSCQGRPVLLNWASAVALAGNSTYDDQSGWRLPSPGEFATIRVCQRGFNSRGLIQVPSSSGEDKKIQFGCSTEFIPVNSKVFDRFPKEMFHTSYLSSLNDTKTVYAFSGVDGHIAASFVCGIGCFAAHTTSDKMAVLLVKGVDKSEASHWNDTLALVRREAQEAEDARVAEAKRAKQAEDAAEKARLDEKKRFDGYLASKNPQAIYLAAGVYQRGGEIGKAGQLYEVIIARFPESQWAVKANDELNSQRRQDDSRRSAEVKSNSNCIAQKKTCESQCPAPGRGWTGDNGPRDRCMYYCDQIRCQ